MINKTERYFVCSESELEDLVTAARYFEAGTVLERVEFEYKKLCQAEAACRAREVREENVGFDNAWVEIKK